MEGIAYFLLVGNWYRISDYSSKDIKILEKTTMDKASCSLVYIKIESV
jgi:hypothetical protein